MCVHSLIVFLDMDEKRMPMQSRHFSLFLSFLGLESLILVFIQFTFVLHTCDRKVAQQMKGNNEKKN